MNIITYEELQSTNAFAKENISSLSNFDVVVANRQTNGRGRLAREWVDLGEGNIFASIILKPSSTFDEKYSNLTQYLSVVICKVIDKCIEAKMHRSDSVLASIPPYASIKWPNDVLINGKKVAGILAETVMQGSKFEGLVLGFGINLKAKSTTQIDKPATALNLELREDINKQEFIQTLLDKFFLNYEKFLEHGFEFIKKDYIERACFLEREICLKLLNETKTGFVKEINSHGELVLIDENNTENIVTIGEII